MRKPTPSNFIEDVKFHDGTPMTADDVVYSINRTIEKGWAADMTAAIDKVEKVDDYTVKLILKKPFGAMIGSLASPYFSVMSKAYAEENGEDAVERKPMGTGAYKFVEWVAGDHIAVEANEEYWGGAPAIKTVNFKPITDKKYRTCCTAGGRNRCLPQCKQLRYRNC